MILSLVTALAKPTEVPPTVPPPSEELPPADDTISRYRSPYVLMAERMVGTASRPVAFDWRRSTLMVALQGSFLFELNNFNSLRGGLLTRIPAGAVIAEIGVSYVGVWNTPSSQLLALTPYRQAGRPQRMEVDIGAAIPIAEGVVTPMAKFLPPMQLVFNAHLGFRYSIYPSGWGGMRPGQVGGAIFNPKVTDIEVSNLDDLRLGAMKVDTARYGLLAGFSTDVYSRSGFFVNTRVMIHIPVLAGPTESDLGFWGDLSLAIGKAF